MPEWFAIATFESAGRTGTGLVLGDQLYVAPLAGDANALIAQWVEAQASLAALADQMSRGPQKPLEKGSYKLLAPYRPGRIFGAASNYYEHAREMGTKLAERKESAPYVFMKAETSVIGPGDTVRIPAQSQKVDWEVELGAVIGRGGRNIAAADALSHVAAYTVINDISARDLNRRGDYPFTHDWFRGKSWDTFAPLGPWLVPAACIADPQNLRLRLDVNGETMQNDTTAGMIFSLAEQIVYLSGILTLRPGDLIATGTPEGTGMGRGIFLKPGDTMTASIEKIGSLTNPVEMA